MTEAHLDPGTDTRWAVILAGGRWHTPALGDAPDLGR